MRNRDPLFRLGHENSEFEYWDDFIGEINAKSYFDELLSQTPWQEQPINIYGKRTALPRLTCWYGDPNAAYKYSGVRNEPRAWTPTLTMIRNTVGEFLNYRFNSVLLNYYRNGEDSLGWHADDEPELGPCPLIASVSLGGERRFAIKRTGDPKTRVNVLLKPDSLLVMKHDAQINWKHSLPKMRAASPRINLTFRFVHIPENQVALFPDR